MLPSLLINRSDAAGFTVKILYTWFFCIGYNPTSLSCVSVSEDDAMQSILNFITQIDEIAKKYTDFPPRYTLEANLNIGCYTTDIYDFHLNMKIGRSDEDDHTLENFIKTTIPKVTPFKLITVFSCLDG